MIVVLLCYESTAYIRLNSSYFHFVVVCVSAVLSAVAIPIMCLSHPAFLYQNSTKVMFECFFCCFIVPRLCLLYLHLNFNILSSTLCLSVPAS